MTASYAAEHASAYADVAAAGTTVTLTRAVTTYDESTDIDTPTTPTTIAGVAMKVKGKPDTYRALSLIESTSPTLFFVPATYGDEPKEGDTLAWSGDTLTVKDVDMLAPSGSTITARLVCVR